MLILRKAIVMSDGDIVRAEHAWFFATGLPSLASFGDLPATAVFR
jgi:hypothetical protein